MATATIAVVEGHLHPTLIEDPMGQIDGSEGVIRLPETGGDHPLIEGDRPLEEENTIIVVTEVALEAPGAVDVAEVEVARPAPYQAIALDQKVDPDRNLQEKKKVLPEKGAVVTTTAGKEAEVEEVVTVGDLAQEEREVVLGEATEVEALGVLEVVEATNEAATHDPRPHPRRPLLLRRRKKNQVQKRTNRPFRRISARCSSRN